MAINGKRGNVARSNVPGREGTVDARSSSGLGSSSSLETSGGRAVEICAPYVESGTFLVIFAAGGTTYNLQVPEIEFPATASTRRLKGAARKSQVPEDHIFNTSWKVPRSEK